MADNEQKNYLEFLDIPNGSGGTERWHVRDEEAQAAIQALPSKTYASESDCRAIVTSYGQNNS